METITLPFPSPEFKEWWEQYLTHRKEKKASKYTPTGLKNCFKNLVELSANDEKLAILIIRQSLNKNWTGLFALQNPINNGNKSVNGSGVQQAGSRIAAVKTY